MIRNSGSGIGHGITGADQFQHFNIVILIAKGDTFFRGDIKNFQKMFQCSSLVRSRCNKINPNISGGYNFNLGAKDALEMLQICS